MKRDFSLLIKDILDCIDKIDEFVGNMSFDEFVKDEKTSSAVVVKPYLTWCSWCLGGK